MGNKFNKMEAKLKQRQSSYDSIAGDKKAFTRPGSQNMRKQHASGSSSKFGRRK